MMAMIAIVHAAAMAYTFLAAIIINQIIVHVPEPSMGFTLEVASIIMIMTMMIMTVHALNVDIIFT